MLGSTFFVEIPSSLPPWAARACALAAWILVASRLSADKDSSGLLRMAVVCKKSCFNARCSLGLEEGFQVGLWRPEEGDLVGEPAKLRCSTGLEVGGVHRGERPS